MKSLQEIIEILRIYKLEASAKYGISNLPPLQETIKQILSDIDNHLLT